MIQKHITKPIKRWAKKKIKNTYLELESEKEVQKEKYNTVIYFPILEDSNSFNIPKLKEILPKCELGLPVPPENLWLGYGPEIKDYLYGKIQVDLMLEILKSSGFVLNGNMKILDFGCGAGRMIRWLKNFSEQCEIWGADISSEHIYWANQYLNPPFNFTTTTTIPHLPFEDGYFDFVYCGSVFTHIDDLTNAWLLELRRISSKNSRLYITINDNHTLKLLETDPVYNKMWLSRFIYSNSLFLENKNDFGKFVAGRGPKSQVFYDLDFFCDSVKTFYDVISATKEAYGYQTGVLLKRK